MKKSLPILLALTALACASFAHAQEEVVGGQGFRQAERLYEQGKLDEAQARFEELARLDPNDANSRRYIKTILSLKRKMALRDQNVMESDRILDVRKAWMPVEHPEEHSAEIPSAAGAGPGRQMAAIVSRIDFSEAALREVLDYLSREGQVNIVFDESPEVEALLNSRITISLTDIPLGEALKYILSAKGLKHRVDEYAVLVSTGRLLDTAQMETRYYHLSSGSAGFVPVASGGREFAGYGEDDFEAEDYEGKSKALTIQEVLEQSGVPSPEGSKVFLDKRTGFLIVRNTPSNLAAIEDILGALDVDPFQIAIEAKFVDIVETAGRELGLQAFLNSDFNLTKQDGTGDFSVLRDANNPVFGQFTGNSDGAGGLTKGLRFLKESGSTTNPAGNIFSFAQVLTQPQFQVVLHALEQSQFANVLSVPRVTTINNREARIEDVTEVIYPSEYDISPATHNAAGTIISPGVAIPGGFETRDTGVIMQVTPSVGGDKKSISLTLVPEVSALTGWNDFGVAAGPSNLGSNRIPVLQPIFTTSNVSTTVIVRDGETVVLGGLVREETDTTQDKIPILGDLPLLGRAFRAEGASSTKRNLLIFVTAYLIRPDGDTVRDLGYRKTEIFQP